MLPCARMPCVLYSETSSCSCPKPMAAPLPWVFWEECRLFFEVPESPLLCSFKDLFPPQLLKINTSFFCLFLFFCSGVGWRISLQSSCAEGLRSMTWTTRHTNPLLSFSSTLEQLSSSMPSLHLLLYSQYPPEKLLRHISDLCWSSIRILLFSLFHYISYPPGPF